MDPLWALPIGLVIAFIVAIWYARKSKEEYLRRNARERFLPIFGFSPEHRNAREFLQKQEKVTAMLVSLSDGVKRAYEVPDNQRFIYTGPVFAYRKENVAIANSRMNEARIVASYCGYDTSLPIN